MRESPISMHLDYIVFEELQLQIRASFNLITEAYPQ